MHSASVILSDMEKCIEDRIQGAALSWPENIPTNKIDTHHHMVPDFYAKAVEEAGGDPSGWKTPSWTPYASKLAMKRLGVQTAILSVTAPGACILSGQASFDLARKLNVYAAEIRDKEPQKFGFFAALPSLLDTDAALEELKYAFDVLHADGVTLFTRYGDSDTYLGHPSIEPIWAELNRREAVVFVHPTHPVNTNKVNDQLPQPMIDYPHETTRAAMDMIIMGTCAKYPCCKVILSHAGGSLPWIISRVTVPLTQTPDVASDIVIGTTFDKAMDAFRSFHYDLALSAAPDVLKMVLAMIPHEHILFGSDFPYAPSTAYPAFLKELEAFGMDIGVRDKINYRNALNLLPRINQSNDL